MKLPRSFLRGVTLPRGPEARTGSSPPRDVVAAHTSAGGAVSGGKQRPDRVDYAVELGAARLKWRWKSSGRSGYLVLLSECQWGEFWSAPR
jgi:hypothetical protein